MPSITPPALVWRRERPDWMAGGPLKLLAAYAEAGDGYGIDVSIMGVPSRRRWRWRVYYRGTMIGTAGQGEAQTLKEAAQAAEVVVADIRANPRSYRGICGTPFIKEWMAEHPGEQPTHEELAEFIRSNISA